MKPKFKFLIAGRFLLPAAAIVSFAGSALAVEITKENNTTAISSAGSWVGGVLPAPGDVMLFDATITGPLTTAGAASMSAATAFKFTTIGGAVTVGVNNGSTITLNNATPTYAIDMSATAADVTIGSPGSTGYIRWASSVYSGISVNTGRTLTMNTNFSNAGNTKAVVMTGGGNIILNGSSNGGGGAMGFSIQGGTNVTMGGTGGWSGSSAKEIISGTMNLASDTALGSATLTLGGTNSSTPTLIPSGGARTISNGISLGTQTTGNATITGSNALTVNGTLTVAGGNRILTVDNSALTTFAGAVDLANSSTSRTLTLNGSGNITISGIIANGSTATASSLTYSGAGLLLLSNANTFAGTLTTSSGTVRLENALAAQNAVVSPAAGLVIASSITSPTFGGLTGSTNFELANESAVALALKLGNTNATYSGTITGSGSLEKIGSGNQTLDGAVLNHTGGTTLTAGTLQINNPSGNTSAIFGSGSLTMNGGRLRLNNSDGSTFNGDLVTTANGGEISYRANGYFNPSSIAGSGTLTLTADNNATLSSNDFQDFAGSFNVGNGVNTIFFRFVSTFDNASLANAALHLTTGVQQTRNHGTNGAVTTNIGTLSGAAGSTVGGSAAGGGVFTYSVGSRNENSNYDGTIVDGGTKTALTKVGNTGILTLGGTNTYTGATIVSAGTLALSGTGGIDSSASVTIAAGAELDTTAKTGTYTLTGTQPFTFGLDGGGAGTSGKIDAASLDISSAAISFDIAGTLDDSQYVLATYSGTLTGTFAASPPAGYTYDYGTGTNSQIKLVSAGASGYDAWDDQIPNAADRDRTDDPDGDGFTNIQEYLFGTSPIAGNGSLSTTEKSGGTLIIRWKERETASEADYQLKESSTLLGGSWTNSAAPVSNDGAASGGYQPRRADVTIGSGKLFFRVEGVETN